MVEHAARVEQVALHCIGGAYRAVPPSGGHPLPCVTVPSYLSAAWIAALGEAVAGSDDLARAAAAPLVVGYEVTDGAEVVTYHVRLAPDGCSAGPGADDADVVFRADRATAMAIARGDLRAQRAFMAGRIQLSGDVSALLDRADALAVLTTIQPPPTDQE